MVSDKGQKPALITSVGLTGGYCILNRGVRKYFGFMKQNEHILESLYTHSVLFPRKAYGVKIHLLNLGVYSLGLLPLTHLIINLRPVANNNISSQNTSLSMVTNSFDKVKSSCPLDITDVLMTLAFEI